MMCYFSTTDHFSRNTSRLSIVLDDYFIRFYLIDRVVVVRAIIKIITVYQSLCMAP